MICLTHKKGNEKYINKMFSARADSYESDARWIKNEKFILPLIPAPYGNKIALDICSGTGVIAGYCKKIGWNVVAVDINEDMLQRVEIGIERVVGNIENLPFQDKCFDISICRQGLQYTDLEKSISEIIRVTDSEVRLAHITCMDALDVDFWIQYYDIAAPSRKHVFTPDYVNKFATNLALKLINQEVLIEADVLLRTTSFLDRQKQNKLLSMINNSTPDFKERNGIVFDGDAIISNRRWEILSYKV